MDFVRFAPHTGSDRAIASEVGLHGRGARTSMICPIPIWRRNRMSKLPSSPRLAAAVAVASLVLLVSCQRKEAPTPGVAGSTANAPAATSSAAVAAPTTGDAQVGAGKSPGAGGRAGGSAPEGISGSGGTMPAPSTAPDPAASGMPAIPPAATPGTAAPSQPVSAPGS